MARLNIDLRLKGRGSNATVKRLIGLADALVAECNQYGFELRGAGMDVVLDSEPDKVPDPPKPAPVAAKPVVVPVAAPVVAPAVVPAKSA